jgi:hypothetical protein
LRLITPAKVKPWWEKSSIEKYKKIPPGRNSGGIFLYARR